MMKLHGGDLEILSEKGIGTTVSLIFPPERVSHKDKKDSPPTLSVSGKIDLNAPVKR